MLSFTARGFYIHTEIACSAVITLGQDEIPDELLPKTKPTNEVSFLSYH